MTNQRTSRRRMARDVARVGAIGSAVMLVFTVSAALELGNSLVLAAENAGPAVVVQGPESDVPGTVLGSGGSATEFSFALPLGASCTGDSATGGYRVQSYFVPASVDPATLTYGLSGPIPTGVGVDLRQSLRQTTSTRYVNQTTGIADTPGGPGQIPSLPGFNFASFGATGPQDVPAGTYNIGIACTVGPASPTQLDRFWNAQITFAADAADVPSGITWQVVAPSAPTTTSPPPEPTTTTTPPPGPTTTPPPGPTTTPPPGSSVTSTTTTSTSSTTTTTLVGSSGAGSVAGGGTSSGGTGGGNPSGTSFGGGGSLPSTGSSPTAIAVWAILLLVFGRMAMLFSRRPKVRQAAD